MPRISNVMLSSVSRQGSQWVLGAHLRERGPDYFKSSTLLRALELRNCMLLRCPGVKKACTTETHRVELAQLLWLCDAEMEVM